MGKRWHRFRNPWDREYAKRGVLWRGVEEASWLRPWISPPARVVDLGCGDGKFLAGLRAAGYDPVGLDFSPHAARLGRARGPAVTVIADVRRMPLAAGSVPFASARYTLGAMTEPHRLQAAQEMARVIGKDGWLLLEEFARDDFRHGTGRQVEPHTFERNQGLLTHYFEAPELCDLFQAWHVALQERLGGRQRVGDGVRPRRKIRLLLRKPPS